MSPATSYEKGWDNEQVLDCGNVYGALRNCGRRRNGHHQPGGPLRGDESLLPAPCTWCPGYGRVDGARRVGCRCQGEAPRTDIARTREAPACGVASFQYRPGSTPPDRDARPQVTLRDIRRP